MQRVTRSTAAVALPSPPASPGTPGFFTGGDPVSNIPPTVPGYEWFNGVQEELTAIVLRAGLSLDAADLAQVRKALDRLHGGGLRTVAANLGLTADDAGLVLVDAAAASRTVTLPAVNAANGRPLRFTFIRVDTAAANTVTIERAGADTIEGLTSITIPVGGRVTLMSDGVSAWRLVCSSGLAQTDVVTATTTLTAPWWARSAGVRLIGAGDGGGGAGANSAGGGGASGPTGTGVYPVTPGESIVVTIGAGGAPGAADGGDGGPATPTSFGARMSCGGGQGGRGAPTGFGAAGSPAAVPSGSQAGTPGYPGGGGIQFGASFVGGPGGGAPGAGGTSLLSTTAGGTGFNPGGGGGGGANGHGGGTGGRGEVTVVWLP